MHRGRKGMVQGTREGGIAGCTERARNSCSALGVHGGSRKAHGGRKGKDYIYEAMPLCPKHVYKV